MTDHDKELYKRVLGIEAEQSLPLQVVQLHEDAEHALHGIGLSKFSPETLVIIMLIAGVLRRNDVEVEVGKSGPITMRAVGPPREVPTTTEPNTTAGELVTPKLGEAVGSGVPTETQSNGPIVTITDDEPANNILDAIPLESAVLVDGVHEAKFMGWGTRGRMKILYPDGSEKLLWRSRIKENHGRIDT